MPVMDPSWLKSELEKPGRSQSALARFLNLEHPSIVNRMVAGTRQIKASEADRIRAYLAATQQSGGSAAISHSGTVPAAAYYLPVRGVVEAGSWREKVLSDLVDPEMLVAPKSIVDTGAFALKVIGPSMDRFYRDGTYVVVEPWAGGPLPVGKHVVVEREKPDGTVEATVKELVRAADGSLELWPRSNSPLHQTPVPFANDDAVLVRLVGRVTWGISPAP